MGRRPQERTHLDLLPDFVVIGAQKSASTALAESLRQHPDVFMPRGETHYFRDPEYAWATPEDLRRPFAGSMRASRRGIKCPDYLGQEDCADRIAAELGLVDIIVVLRNPVDRAISHYFWLMRWGQLPVESVDVGMARVLRGEYRGARYADEILDYGLYGKHLERYVKTYGEERVLVLLDSDLRAGGRSGRSRVYRFLGVDDQFEPSVARRGRNEGVYPLPRLRFLRLRNRFVYDNGNPMTGTMRRPRRADQALLNASVVLADRYLLAPVLGNAKPVLPPQVREALVNFYAEDIRRTERLIGRDLSAWLEGHRSDGGVDETQPT
jgi:hypothetical protein